MITTRLCEHCSAPLSGTITTCPACKRITHIPHTPDTPRPRGLAPLQPKVFSHGFLLAGRYRIEEKIGEGGFGVVYKARDTAEHNRPVAIKQITLSALSAQEQIEATDSYNREVTLLAKLRHRHLAQLYDHFTDAENWYLVLEYIDGKTLEEVLAETSAGRLPVGQVIAIGRALCDVLGYLHVQDPPIIFRDVKPANLLLKKDGSIALIDFGIARRYRPEQRKDTGPLGSPGYAAPEQYGRGQSSPRTDIYGLGMTLQTLLTGTEPLEVRAHGWPPACEIPMELYKLLLHMTDPDPDQRPAYMVSVGVSLQTLQEQHPYAPPPPPPQQPAPTAWLVPLWILVLQILGIFLITKLLLLCTIFTALTIILRIYTQMQSQGKGRKAYTQDQASKNVQHTIKNGLIGVDSCVTSSFGYSLFFIVFSLSDHSHTHSLLIDIVYVITGVIVINALRSGRLPFRKFQIRQVSTTSSQQPQQLLMYQHQRKNKP